MSKLIFITEEFAIREEMIAAIAEDNFPFNGTRVYLVQGDNFFLEGITPAQIMKVFEDAYDHT